MSFPGFAKARNSALSKLGLWAEKSSLIGDIKHGTAFQRQILGIMIDNPEMISLEPCPCHLLNKVYRGFNTNQKLGLWQNPVIILTVNGLEDLIIDFKGKKRQFWWQNYLFKVEDLTIIEMNSLSSDFSRLGCRLVIGSFWFNSKWFWKLYNLSYSDLIFIHWIKKNPRNPGNQPFH